MRSYFISFLFLLLVELSFAQTWNAYHQNIVDNCTLSNTTNNINEFVAFGEKNAASNNTKYNNLVAAKNWLISKYQSYGYTDVVEDNFTYNGKTVTNVVVTKIGELYPNTFVIIDGHYDTLNGVGANDNGSGVSLILEIARVMVNVPTAYSIKFINFTVEEQGLHGSYYYANTTSLGLDIRYVFNIDEVGGVAGMTNNTITCESDQGIPNSNNEASAILTNELATSIELYSSLNTQISYAYNSDYMSFENKGEIITGLYETNETPYAHTSSDIIANMDIPYVFEITKGSAGALLHFAQANESLKVNDEYNELTNVKVFPNPIRNNRVNFMFNSANLINKKVDVKLVDILGNTILKTSFNSTTKISQLELNQFNVGVYFIVVNIEGKEKRQKVMIK